MVLVQNLNIRAKNQLEAYTIAKIVCDARLNRLYTTTTVSELNGELTKLWTSEPLQSELSQLFDQGVEGCHVVVIREAGINPFTGEWSDQAEGILTIHVRSEQEAWHITNFISALPFSGQLRRTIINGIEHFDARY